MSVIFQPHRWLYLGGTLLAGWVAAWGLAAPAEIDRAMPWQLPPLHARFIGSFYLSGAIFLAAMAVTSRWSRQWVIVPMIVTWTGGLFVVLLWQWHTVRSVSPATVVWLVAYSVLPLAESVRFWRRRREPQEQDGLPAPRWLRRFLAVSGLVVLGFAAVLLLLPEAMVMAWPWPVEPYILRIYAPPFAAFGVGFLLGARRPFGDLAILLPVSAVFAAAAITVSAVHRRLFDGAHVATWVWFAGFATALAGLVLGSVTLVRAGRVNR